MILIFFLIYKKKMQTQLNNVKKSYMNGPLGRRSGLEYVDSASVRDRDFARV